MGNPFDAVTGNKYHHAVDVRSPLSPLAFARHYNSALAGRSRGLGRGWRNGFSVELARLASGGYAIRQADGRLIEFPVAVAESKTDSATASSASRRFPARDPGDGWFEPDDGYVWHLDDGRRMRFDGPHLVAIDYPDGDVLSVQRNGSRVDAVSDGRGDVLRFEYAPGAPGLAHYGEAVQLPSGHLAKLHLPNGTAVSYLYDDSLQLISALDASGQGVRYRYHDDATQPGLLTAVSDEASGYEGRWRYEQGRAVESFDPVRLDGYVVANRTTHGAGSGSIESHSSHGDVELLSWSTDSSRPLRPAVERRSSEAPSDYATLALLPSQEPDASSSTGASMPEAPSLTVEPIAFDSSYTVDIEGTPTVVRAFFDRFGTIVDLELDGRRSSEVARDLAETADGGCAGANRATCLDTARQHLDALRAVEAQRALDDSSAAVERKRQHDPAGPACPLPRGVDCARLEHQLEMANLSNCVYATATCSTQYQQVAPSALGLTANELSFGVFHAEVFRNPVTGDFVLSFRGTDEGGDWWDNGRNVVGWNSAQYSRATRIAETLQTEIGARFPSAELEVTGHSLGGGLATIAAIAIDRPATVFNAAALHEDTAAWNGLDIRNAGYLVDAIIVRGEPVSTTQRIGGIFNFLFEQLFGIDNYVFVGDAPGDRIRIPRPDQTWIDSRVVATGASEPLVLHSIAGVIRSLDLLHDEHCTP